jgi:NADH-quinone oxidoreductase subunit J
MIPSLFFYVLSAVLVLSAVMVISARNPVHAVLFLILAFFNAGGLFVLLGAEFIAMILVIVYVGAVAVLFLFVVMMLDINFGELRRGMGRYLPLSGLVGTVMLVEFFWVFSQWTVDERKAAPAAHMLHAPAQVENTRALGQVLYTHYAYIFQLSGLVLLVAMIGAITLTLRHRPNVRRQDVSSQVDRRPKDVLRVEKINSGEGVS